MYQKTEGWGPKPHENEIPGVSEKSAICVLKLPYFGQISNDSDKKGLKCKVKCPSKQLWH